MSTPATAIPYQKQSDPQTSRSCGAACLSMVYRSFGMEVPQDQIWPAIAKPNRFGSVSSTTHLMTQDAVNRGFQAVAVHARHPLHVLRLCRDSGVRAIINHRLRPDVTTGHYSVLVHVDEQSVTLHDPLLGPDRRLTHAEMLELWLPYFKNSEIAGNVLIGVAPAEAAEFAPCEFCHTAIPARVECPRCKNPVGLRPGVVMGCITDNCIARMWNYICCPSCDYVWTFTGQPAQTAAGPSQPAQGKPARTVDFNRVFGELDKFTSHITSIPVLANNPDIQKQLEFMSGSRERLKMAFAEQMAGRSMRQAQMAAAAQAVKQGQEEQRKRAEEMNRPLPPLDGQALARALLKNLGFTK